MLRGFMLMCWCVGMLMRRRVGAWCVGTDTLTCLFSAAEVTRVTVLAKIVPKSELFAGATRLDSLTSPSIYCWPLFKCLKTIEIRVFW